MHEMGESQKQGANVQEARQRVMPYPSILGNFRTQAKLIYGGIKQMSGCWSWRGNHCRGAWGDLFLG